MREVPTQPHPVYIFLYKECRPDPGHSQRDLLSGWEQTLFWREVEQAGQISDDKYEELDKLHYKVENELIKLIESLQRRHKDDIWKDNFQGK